MTKTGSIPGMRYVAELPAGARIATFRDRLVVCAPDAPPYFLNEDGSREEITFSDVPMSDELRDALFTSSQGEEKP